MCVYKLLGEHFYVPKILISMYVCVYLLSIALLSFGTKKSEMDTHIRTQIQMLVWEIFKSLFNVIHIIQGVPGQSGQN